MRFKLAVLVLAASAMGFGVGAAERNLADALAAAGAATAAKGNTSQAKDLLYTALAHDENCPDALFELARIVDKEGDAATAGDLYQHAALVLAQEGKPAATGKRAEAEKRARVLSPIAMKLSAAFEDYASDLDKVVKKLPDPLTESTAQDLVNDLQLASILPPEKLPKFYSATPAAQPAKPASSTADSTPPNNNQPGKRRRPEPEKPKAEGATAPEIEKELKALGWNTVAGVWIKKAPGVYEATDAKLEVAKTNGVMDFVVVKGGGDGTIKATVRTEPKSDNQGPPPGGGGPGGPPGFGEPEMLGYGIHFRGKDFKNFGYGERGGFGGRKRGGDNGGIVTLGTYPIADAAKSHFTIKIDDNTLDLFYNDSRKNSVTNGKTTKTGPFVLDVIGTVTLENPRCSGQ